MCDRQRVEIKTTSEDFKIAAFEARLMIKGDIHYYGRMAFGVPAKYPQGGTILLFVQFSEAGCCATCSCSTAKAGFTCAHIAAACQKLAVAQAWDASKKPAAKKSSTLPK